MRGEYVTLIIIVLVIISCAADVNVEDEDMVTPLHLAAEGGSTKITSCLLG